MADDQVSQLEFHQEDAYLVCGELGGIDKLVNGLLVSAQSFEEGVFFCGEV